MLIRYKKDANGASAPLAEIYSPSEHKINLKAIDPDAIWAIRKLKQSGAEAYIVGGAVRDLMLGLRPKDFDIATSASPRQIQKLFWNARIIGKRFKLVHLMFHDKILEISTFRSGEDPVDDDTSSIFGTIEQDAKRRDFSINSLYLDPTDGSLFDFNHAFDDFRHRRIRSVIPLSFSFIEDPVRMLRAVKYSVTTGFHLQHDVKKAIRKHANELARIPASRITEEVSKILNSGNSAGIIKELQRFRLLVYMLPCISVSSHFPEILISLEKLDGQVRNSHVEPDSDGVPKGELFRALTAPLVIVEHDSELTLEDMFKDIFRQMKVLISPITPANYDVEFATECFMKGLGLNPPKSVVRSRRPNLASPWGMGGQGARTRRQNSSSRMKKSGAATAVSTPPAELNADLAVKKKSRVRKKRKTPAVSSAPIVQEIPETTLEPPTQV